MHLTSSSRSVWESNSVKSRTQKEFEVVAARELLLGSVQIWAHKIELLGLDRLPGRDEVFWWPHAYDPAFLGYMEGALHLESIAEGAALIV